MTVPRRSVRALGRALVVAAAVAAALVAVARPAGAHAVLESSAPAAGERLASSPPAVELRFNEPVEASLGAVRVYDADGRRLDTGAPSVRDGVVRAALPDLGDGTYVATWHVVSADSHPVRGAFVFTVGSGAPAPGAASLADRLLAAEGADAAVGAALGVGRLVLYAGLALAVGVPAFALVVWAPARRAPGARRLAWAGLGAAAAASVAVIALQGPYAAGLGIGDALDPGLWREVVETRLGRVQVLRLALLVAAVPVVAVVFPRRDPSPPGAALRAGAGVLAVALAATPALGGHASSGGGTALAVAVDTVHVLAMAVWLGGLGALSVTLLAGGAPDRDPPGALAALDRFSRLALACVAAVVASGAARAWREVGSVDGLTGTDYGRLLLVKVALVAVIVAVAAASRAALHVWQGSTLPPPVPATAGVGAAAAPGGSVPFDDERWARRRLRRGVLLEVVLAVVVLATTALLVNTAPARAELDGGPYAATIGSTDPAYRFDVIVTPGRRGPNDVHVTAITPTGGPRDALSAEVTLSMPSRDIAPITVPLRRIGPGHYFSPGFDVPIAGDWLLAVQMRVTPSQSVAASTTVTIR